MKYIYIIIEMKYSAYPWRLFFWIPNRTFLRTFSEGSRFVMEPWSLGWKMHR